MINRIRHHLSLTYSGFAHKKWVVNMSNDSDFSPRSSQSVMSSILIVTSYFLINPRKIAGGISEHYVGLYGTFIRSYSRIYKIFWYSVYDNTLRTFDSDGNIVSLDTMAMPIAILKVLAEARKSSRSIPSFSAIIAYYYAAQPKPMSFVISLLLLHLLKIVGIANLIVDVIDPPVEVHVTYSDSPSGMIILLGTFLDTLTLKKGAVISFCSNSYRRYLTTKYGIHRDRTHVIYDGGVPELIIAKPPRAEGPLTVFYSGSLMNIKGIPQLIESVNTLRKKGIEVNLLLVGPNMGVKMDKKPWIRSGEVDDWYEWKKILCEQADICVIPYPRRVHWDLTHHMKLADYMAAGKPVVSMYGTETANLLRRFECGLVANSWKEFETHIVELYNDRELAKTLGCNGRKAVEEFFNYTNLAAKLHDLVQNYIRIV